MLLQVKCQAKALQPVMQYRFSSTGTTTNMTGTSRHLINEHVIRNAFLVLLLIKCQAGIGMQLGQSMQLHRAVRDTCSGSLTSEAGA